MSAAMRVFYAFLLAWTRIDIQIALSTGRSPDHVAVLRRDEDEYERALLRLELGL